MNNYIKQIFKFIVLIVQKKRKQNLFTSKTNFEVTPTDFKNLEINKELKTTFQEEKNTSEKIEFSDSEIALLPTEVKENKNEEILNYLIYQPANYINSLIEFVNNESKSENEIIEVETYVLDKVETIEDDKIITNNNSENKITEKINLISFNNDSNSKVTLSKLKSHFTSNYSEPEYKEHLSVKIKMHKTSNFELSNDVNELLQKVNRIFIEHKLLGNFDFSENEYSEMLENVGLLCNSLLHSGSIFEEKYHKLIFTTLVEIAKRWKEAENIDEVEDNSRFWNYVSKYLVNDNNINQKLYHAFIDSISQLGRNENIPIVLSGQKYYSTLMMHSFSPKNSLFSFYDLCYNIFKKDLDFGYTSDDEWLCKIVAEQLKTVLSRSSCENKKVSIGSSAYSIKIGLKSFSQNEELSIDFENFIKETFYHINKLFNREQIDESTRLKRYIVEWWKNKTEFEKNSEGLIHKKRHSTVAKEDITVKYIRDDKSVLLYIPSIRLLDINRIVTLNVFVKNELIYTEEIRTKQGELVVTTKQVELDLNDLLRYIDTISIRVEIIENQKIIFDSDLHKSTSLNREFILFEGDKEVFSQIKKPTNYFVYSKDIDSLKIIPDELTTYGPNLYNIYPKPNESISGEIKQVLFLDEKKTAKIGKAPCLIGEMQNVEWFYEDISCIVYTNVVKLLIPKNVNLKALELRIDKKAFKLHELSFERIESDCFQFSLFEMGLIHENQPIEIELFSFENNSTIFSETMIVLPKLIIQFNHPFYYGDIEGKLIIKNGENITELTWNNQDNEIKYPLNDGMLIIQISYLRWKINNNEWYNEPITKKLWYKDFLANGDTLEIDNPKENDELTLFGKINGKQFEIVKNQNGKFEIGRTIYANQNITDISVQIVLENNFFEIFTISTKEHFIRNPLIYNDGKVFWNVEDTFVGDKTSEFFIIVRSADNNFRSKINYKNCEIKNLNDDICKIQVKIKDKNIFSKAENYLLIYEGELLIGAPEKLRFKNKKILLLSANCFESKQTEWIPFIPKYFIDNLKFIQEFENIYYIGQLCVIDKNNETKVINTMINEKGVYDKTNPVRIELRDNSTLWLAAGWEEGDLPLGNLFCDKMRKGICNIQKQDNHFGEINLYKFKEEDYV